MGGFLIALSRRGCFEAARYAASAAATSARSSAPVAEVRTPSGVLLIQVPAPWQPDGCDSIATEVVSESAVHLVKRGHLSNRGNLARSLGLPADSDDASVMLAAYLAWGRSWGGRLIGEFTVAVWDGRSEEVVVLRDHLGRRGCYIHDGPDWFVAASEPAQILPFLRRADLDEDWLLDYASGSSTNRTRTMYRDIKRPLPASTMVATKGGTCESGPYWRPHTSTQYRAKPPEAYAPEIRSVIDAVISELAADAGPTISCELSGGLDSTGIAGAVVAMKRAGRVDADVKLASWLYPGLPCDESPYIHEARDLYAVPWRGFERVEWPDPPSPRWSQTRNSIRYLAPRTRDLGIERLETWLQASAIPVNLSGHGGDALFHSGGVPFGLSAWRQMGLSHLSWLAGGSPRALVARVRREHVRRRVPTPLLHMYLRARGAERVRHRFLTEAASARREEIAEIDFDDPIVDRGEIEFWSPAELSSVGIDDAITIRSNYENRFPFFDPRVIDAIAAVPLLAHCWEGGWRTLQRAAFADVYPNSVLERQTKAEFSPSVMRGLVLLPLCTELKNLDIVNAEAYEAHRRHLADNIDAGAADGFSWSFYCIASLNDWMTDGFTSEAR